MQSQATKENALYSTELRSTVRQELNVRNINIKDKEISL